MHSCVDASCHALSNPKQLQMSAMEAIAAVGANTKAKAEPKKMRLASKAKAASGHCADLAAYNKTRRSKCKEIHSGCQKAGATRQEDASQAECDNSRF